MKVLIVDDSQQMRQMVKFYLRGIVGETRECEDGVEALDAYAEFRPDWVLMDWEMKELDGISATRQIKAAFPEARIMIVTQYDDAAPREAARTAGACEYVLKDDLVAVRRILNGDRPGPSA